MSQKLETSKASGAHYRLGRLEGKWEGTARTWFEPDSVADESPMSGTMKLVLGGRFILHEYTGSMGGKPLEGLALYGYHLELQRYQSAWIDSFHNGSAIMFSEGARGGDRMDVLGSYAYVSPEEEQHWGWRRELELVTDDELRITAYNVTPEGEEQKATEVIYRRAG